MANKVTFKVKLRRRREGKTNYRKRLSSLKSDKPRLVVRLKSRMISAQIIEYGINGDKTLLGTNSLELKKHGWAPKRNIPTAYLTGYLIGKKAIQKGIKAAIFDIGLHTPVNKGRIFAVLNGTVDSGMQVPHNDKAFPTEDRINGKHIETYRKIKLDIESTKKKINDIYG